MREELFVPTAAYVQRANRNMTTKIRQRHAVHPIILYWRMKRVQRDSLRGSGGDRESREERVRTRECCAETEATWVDKTETELQNAR